MNKVYKNYLNVFKINLSHSRYILHAQTSFVNAERLGTIQQKSYLNT